MKNLYSLFLLTILSTTLFAQTTRRVNGDPDITGVYVYNTIQAAVDAANTDDVILIEPYGSTLTENPFYNETVNVNKKLHFRGSGTFLNNPMLPIDLLDRRTLTIYGGRIEFNTGSDASTIRNLTAQINVSSSNILIESVSGSVNFGTVFNSNNELLSQGIGCRIRKSFIGTVFDGRASYIKSVTDLNLNIQNSSIGSFQDLSKSIIKNCYFIRLIRTNNLTITNCITIGESKFFGLGSSNQNNNMSFCISFGEALPSNNNNINNASWEQVYTGSGYSSLSYVGENAQILRNDSIAKSAGIEGGDIGIYGGAYPYEKGGLPHHPITTFFINSGIGNNDIDLDAVITIKAN